MAEQLRVGAHPDHIEEQQRDRADHETRQAAREADAHQQGHERLQDERQSHGHDGSNKKHPSEVQNRDDHPHADDGQGEVTRFLNGLAPMLDGLVMSATA